jgi:hypothetical protein
MQEIQVENYTDASSLPVITPLQLKSVAGGSKKFDYAAWCNSLNGKAPNYCR